MKKTITGWMNPDFPKVQDRDGFIFLREKVRDFFIPVTITFDDGKPNTKTVWEWMYFEEGCWCTSDSLLSEDDAAVAFKDLPHKKLREFQVEVES